MICRAIPISVEAHADVLLEHLRMEYHYPLSEMGITYCDKWTDLTTTDRKNCPPDDPDRCHVCSSMTVQVEWEIDEFLMDLKSPSRDGGEEKFESERCQKWSDTTPNDNPSAGCGTCRVCLLPRAVKAVIESLAEDLKPVRV